MKKISELSVKDTQLMFNNFKASCCSDFRRFWNVSGCEIFFKFRSIFDKPRSVFNLLHNQEYEEVFK